jgi:hypothetical protein
VRPAARHSWRWQDSTNEAAAAQIAQLDDISENLHTAGAHYSTTDEEQAGSLAAPMGGFGDNTAGVHPAAAQPATVMRFNDTFRHATHQAPPPRPRQLG